MRAPLRSICQPGRNDILCSVPCGIGCGTVDLGAVFAGKCPAAVTTHATISIDYYFSAGESRITMGPANHETTGGMTNIFVFASIRSDGLPR